MSDLPSTPLSPCPECAKLRTGLEEALQQIARLQVEVRELRCAA